VVAAWLLHEIGRAAVEGFVTSRALEFEGSRTFWLPCGGRNPRKLSNMICLSVQEPSLLFEELAG
jgi:hypothetical protein